MSGRWGTIRARLRRSGRLVSLVRRIRRTRGGRAVPPTAVPVPDDRIRERIEVRLQPGPGGPARLTLLLPTLAGKRSFAGVASALDLFHEVAVHSPRRRIATVAPLPADVEAILPGYAVGDAGGAPAQVVSLAAGDGLQVGPADRFMATFWTTADLARRILAWQDATFGIDPAVGGRRAFGYLVQDFEPGFYPWSAQWLLARSTYDDPDRTVAIFNTALLRSYFHDQGIRFGHEFSFEPRLWPALQDAARSLAGRAVDDRPRTRRIVVYGRPSTPRNAFPLIVDGLRRWVATDPGAAAWSFVSAGERHAPIDLGRGRVLEPAGKLDFAGYAALLQTSMIGISLMVSPHPSFPPLEMAYLGLRVVSNRFGPKDLATWHENVESLDEPTPEGLARALADLSRRLVEDPELGSRGRPLGSALLDEGPQFPFAAELARLLGLNGNGPG